MNTKSGMSTRGKPRLKIPLLVFISGNKNQSLPTIENTTFGPTCFDKVPHRHPVFCPSVSLSVHLDVKPGREVHLNGLFAQTTAPMVVKFHMQHDQTAGLQTGKVQHGRESKMATDT